MLLGRIPAALGLEGEQRLDQPWPRVPRIDDVVEVAARRRLIRVRELVAVVVGALFVRFPLVQDLDRPLRTHHGDRGVVPGQEVFAPEVWGSAAVASDYVRSPRHAAVLGGGSTAVGAEQLAAELGVADV